MAQGNTLDLKILAANRSLASAFCLLDEIKKYAELSIHTSQVERKAIEQHLSSVTNDGQQPPEKQGAYMKLQQRLSELDRLETVAHEIIDQSDLVLNTDVAPSGLPKTWREKTMEGATIRPTDQGFIDEDADGATRRYSRPQPQNDGVNLSETGKHMAIPDGLKHILSTIPNKALVVGGAVRDAVQGHTPKDFDIEVYGTNYDDLHKHLSQHGRVDTVGKSFGVLKLNHDGEDYDFSIPRRENKTGIGHTDFNVDFDPSITPKEAASRRDFSMNSLAYDPKTDEVLDPFGGLKDIKNKVLKHTSDAFAEDPLRVLRGMQFASRFGMDLHPDTAKMIREQMSAPEHYNALAKERIAEEWMKWATKGKQPGKAIKYLQDSGWINHTPEIANMVNVPQDPEWHPEGEVHKHTAHVLDAAAKIADREGLQGDDRATLVFAALAHDFAKAHTTELTKKGDSMRWTAHDHERQGGPLAVSFLKSIGIKQSIIDRVKPLVENHLAHIGFVGDPNNDRFVRKLAQKLGPATMRELGHLIEADHSGRPPLAAQMPIQARMMLEAAERNGVHDGPMKPLIQGRDVMGYFGGVGGPHIGEVTKAAHQAQLNASFSTPSESKKWLDKHVRGKVAILNGDDVLPHFDGKGGPHIAKVLDAAWEAQKAGEFKDKTGAAKWLKKHLKQPRS